MQCMVTVNGGWAVPDSVLDPAEGDPREVFAALFDQHAAHIGRYLARRVGRRTAEDLVAEVFLEALASRATFEPMRASPRAWLFGIATNLVRRHFRAEERAIRATDKAGRQLVLVEPGADHGVAARLDAAATMARLGGALVALAPGDRDVLLLNAWAGLASTEIAVALGIPEGTVRSRLNRVRRQLRTALTPITSTEESA